MPKRIKKSRGLKAPAIILETRKLCPQCLDCPLPPDVELQVVDQFLQFVDEPIGMEDLLTMDVRCRLHALDLLPNLRNCRLGHVDPCPLGVGTIQIPCNQRMEVLIFFVSRNPVLDAGVDGIECDLPHGRILSLNWFL